MTLSEAYKKLAKSFKNGVYLEPVHKTNWNPGCEFYLTKAGDVYGVTPNRACKVARHDITAMLMLEHGIRNDFRLTSTL